MSEPPSAPVAAERSDVLPEFWPDESPRPVRRVWIPWPIAVLLAPLFWLMPCRFGPHLAASGWRAAIAAHLVWGVYGVVSIAMTALVGPAYSLPSWLMGYTPEHLGYSIHPVPGLGEILRQPLAMLAFGLQMGNDLQVLGMLAGALATDAGIIQLLAAASAPFVAAGEKSSLLTGRSVRLGLWASTSLVVFALAWQTLAVLEPALPLEESLAALAGLHMLWALRLAIRGGSRYVGPAEGPRWERRAPQCEGCGYALTGLPTSANCPECGRPVTESLPERRTATAWSASKGWRAPQAFLQTWRSVLRDGSFCSRLRTGDALPSASSFAVWACVLAATAGLVVAGIACLVMAILRVHHPPHEADLLPRIDEVIEVLAGITAIEVLAIIVAAVWAWLVVGLLVAVASVAGAIVAAKRQPLVRVAAATFYWSAWLTPLLATLAVCVVATAGLLELQLFSKEVEVPWLRTLFGVPGRRVDLYLMAVLFAGLVPSGAMVWVALRRLAWAVRQVRFANA